VNGKRGVKRHEPLDPNYAATAPTELTALAEWSATKGRTAFPTWGNLTWPNCFWAMLGNMTLLQAQVSQEKYVEGFTPPPSADGIEWYKVYCVANGQPPTIDSQGTGIYSGAASILAQKLARYVGVLGPPYSVALIREALWDFDGGCGFCLALDPDADQEFDEHLPWGADSTQPDAADGHAVAGCFYDPTNTGCVTWGVAPQLMTAAFDTNCVDGLVLVITEGFITKFGEARAAQLASKWGLTKEDSPVSDESAVRHMLIGGDSAEPQPARYQGKQIWGVYVAGAAFHIWTKAEVAGLAEHGIKGVMPIVVPAQDKPWWDTNAGYAMLEELVREAAAWGVPKGSPLCLDVEEAQAARMLNAGEVARSWAVACNAHEMIPWVYSSAGFLATDKFTNKWLAHWPDPTPTDPQVPEGYRAWQYAGNADGIDEDAFLANEIFLSPDLTPITIGGSPRPLQETETTESESGSNDSATEQEEGVGATDAEAVSDSPSPPAPAPPPNQRTVVLNLSDDPTANVKVYLAAVQLLAGEAAKLFEPKSGEE